MYATVDEGAILRIGRPHDDANGSVEGVLDLLHNRPRSHVSLDLTTTPHSTAPAARVGALTSHHLECGVTRVVPAGDPPYTRAQHAEEPVGGSTTTRA